MCAASSGILAFLSIDSLSVQYGYLTPTMPSRRRQWHPTLAWKIPWAEEPGRLQSMGSQRVGHDWATWLSFFTFMHWRRKWQPLQCSCMENLRDGGAWWAAIYGVAQSRTRLKWLSSSMPSPVLYAWGILLNHSGVLVFFSSFVCFDP